MLVGHPLSMRVILKELQNRPAGELITILRSNLAALNLDDADMARLYGTFKFVEEGLSAQLRCLLTPLSFHERFVDGKYLTAITHQAGAPLPHGKIADFLGALANAGLLINLHRDIRDMYFIHPALIQLHAFLFAQ